MDDARTVGGLSPAGDGATVGRQLSSVAAPPRSRALRRLLRGKPDTIGSRGLPMIDGRTARGARYLDIMATTAAEFPLADSYRLCELVGLRFSIEAESSAIVAHSGTKALDVLVRLQNILERKEKALRARSRQAQPPGRRPVAPPKAVRDHLASRYEKATP